MQTWVIRRIDDLAALNRWYLVNGDQSLFVDRFSINNVFGIALREGGIAGVAEGNDYNNDNTDEIPEPEPNTKTVVDPNPEEPDDNPGISLDPYSDHGNIAGVPQPEDPVNLPGVVIHGNYRVLNLFLPW